MVNFSRDRASIPDKKAAVFVDGFNVYHFINEHHPWAKWLDYRRLAAQILPRNITVSDVFYFSARAWWNQGKMTRHNHYIAALRTKGITPVMGRFVNREKNFIVPDRSSQDIYTTVAGRTPGRIVKGFVNEEKMTDVNIAAHIVALAARKLFDVALLVSSDTDFVPVIHILNRFFGDRSLMIAAPSMNVPAPFLDNLPPSACRRIKGKHLRKSLLEDPVPNPRGTDFRCPDEWR